MPSKCKSTFLHGECLGHLGKFDSCRDEALHDIAVENGDGCGDSDWRGWASLVIVAGEPMPHKLHDGPIVKIEPGFYIVLEATSGAVCVYEFTTQEAAQLCWDVWVEAYNAWDASS